MLKNKIKDAPIPGRQYLLMGGSDEKCISNGNTWAESIIEEKEGK